MRGYWCNNGGAGGLGKIFAGVYPSASHTPSLFATCNSQILIKPPYNGVCYDTLDFNKAHYTGNGKGYFDFVPGAWGTLNTSITVGDFGYWKVKVGNEFLFYPNEPAVAAELTPVEPLFQVRVYFNSSGSTTEELPPLLGLTSQIWKENRHYASMGAGGKAKANYGVYDPAGVQSIQSVPNVSTGVYPASPLDTQRQQLGAIWGVGNIGTQDGLTLYPGFTPIDLPLEIANGIGTGVTVRKWATSQYNPPSEGGTLRVVWRLAWFPLSILTYYQEKLGTNYPYL